MSSGCNIFFFSYLRCRRVTVETTGASIPEVLVKILFFIFILARILFFILIEIIVLILHLRTGCIESFRLLEKKLQCFDIFIIIFFLYYLLLRNQLFFILIVIIIVHVHGCEISWRAYDMVGAIVYRKQYF
jgi:hypothetical protein